MVKKKEVEELLTKLVGKENTEKFFKLYEEVRKKKLSSEEREEALSKELCRSIKMTFIKHVDEESGN
jgi:hypothetical protein